VEVDLGDNVNQFGVPPAAERALRATEPATLTRYPEPYADRLRAALARYAGVEPDEVVAGCGSDDLIDAALRAFAEGGDRVAQCDPSFSMVPAFARANGLEPVAVPFASGNAVDVEALLAARARVVYLCSPNNPTGTVAARAAVEEVLARAGGLVLLDEAYAEFAGESWASAAPARGNLLVLRTLSKAFGLAGLRVGYAVGDRALVAELEKARGPYRVSGPAERTALAALTEDVEWMRARAAEAVACRGRLRAGLTALGFAPLPSAANFLLVPVPDAKAAAAVLARAGIGVRAFPGLSGIGDALRITAAPWPVMERVLAAAAAFAPRREVAR
jgi:histidinol-phosphate aminotransferase